jgi:3-polyprenyl-4-hydroxybenzoate decarboxylase
MVLELVYEQDFLPCSFGFRPGRSAHQALQSLRTALMSQGLRWVVDMHSRRRMWEFHRRAAAKGQNLPAAVTLGVHPLHYMGSR